MAPKSSIMGMHIGETVQYCGAMLNIGVVVVNTGANGMVERHSGKLKPSIVERCAVT